ncbi:hypothetical protein ACL9RF_14060 [Sphingobacterium sp. Mn56C]|uniref:hypothetical protein n=1 Tax=Sphingobacterium sp. Mn56C TaxID=3395261 RepID=UPI003BC2061E
MKINTLAAVALALTISFGTLSCSKDKDNDNQEVVVPEYNAKVKVKDGETVDLIKVSVSKDVQGTLTRIGNRYKLREFRQGVLNDNKTAVGTPNASFYYDFKENDGTTNDGALSLAGAGRNYIMQANLSKGYKLAFIDKSFDQVTATDSFTEAAEGKLGLNSATTAGWITYSGNPNHQLIPVANRTFIILKDNKPQFKFVVNSTYSNEKPEKEVQPTNYYFYSIDYQEFK